MLSRGSEIKRELASLSSVLIDIPQDDVLKTDLDRCNKRLKGLALKRLDCIFGDLNSYLNGFCMKEILESKVQDCQDGSRDGADLQCYLDGCYRATISWLLQ